MIKVFRTNLWAGLLLWCAAAFAGPLEHHPSPYLALHAADPVQWRLLDAGVLEQARREGKLIFISSGYFSCHWCHVMQRESFRDAEVARYLNQHFIPVKIDRELSPELDAYLIDFVQRTRGRAGWPLSAFLTPQGHPLFGSGYQPRDEFLAQLQRLQQRWGEERSELSRMAAAALHVAETHVVDGAPVPAELRRRLVQQALADADMLAGGFGEQAKFPSVPLLQALLAAHAREPATELGPFLRLTLEQMSGQGLQDQLGGGFFRYTIDPAWQQPHFEKMLYDNAQLARLYLQAATLFGRDDFSATGRAALEFMLREMGHPDGGFIAALAAQDVSGSEGGYYLWPAEQLHTFLGAEERGLAILAYGLDGVPLFDGGHLPQRPLSPERLAGQSGMTAERVAVLLNGIERKMRAVRAQRSLPRDEKRISAWNGLALSALAAGARLPQGELFRAAGLRLRQFIAQQLWDGTVLLRARGPQGEALDGATLEDYALVCQGLLEWSAFTAQQADVRFALQVAEAGWRLFFTGEGWRQSAASVIPLPQVAVLPDGALPSPAATLGRCTLELAQRFELPELTDKARRALQLGGGRVVQDPPGFASYVEGITTLP